MTDQKLNNLLQEAMSPHLARTARKIHGCPEGELICQYCGATNASKNRQMTAYHNSDNMATLCPACQQEADEYWEEMWSGYYHGCL